MINKFFKAIQILKPNTEIIVHGDIVTENDFNNNVEWITGKNEMDKAITTTTNPHSELTWTKVKTEMDKL